MFYKFLIDEGHVGKEDLVQAVIDQLESMPSLLRVLLEKNILDYDRAIDLIFKSLKDKVSVIDLVRGEGIEESSLMEILTAQNEKGKGVSQILLEKGIWTREKFDEVFKAFESYTPSSEPAQAPKEETKSESEPSSGAPAISAAALESLKAVSDVNSEQLAELEANVSTPKAQEVTEEPSKVEHTSNITELISNEGLEKIDSDNFTVVEYLDFYNEPFQSDLFVVANRYRLKGREKDLVKLHESFTKILSLAKLNNFEVHIKLLEPLEDFLSQIMNGSDVLNDQERGYPFEALEVLWPLRNSIANEKTEAAFLENDKDKDNYINVLKNILSKLKRSA